MTSCSMRRFLIFVLAGLLVLAPRAYARDDDTYIRVVEPDEQTTQLQVAIRTLVPRESGPVIRLVGAVHIADPDYYRRLQAWLDVHDTVLYEGVGAHAETAPASSGDAMRTLTERRLRLVGVAAQRAHDRLGRYPASAEQILVDYQGTTRSLIAESLVDAWGNPVQLKAGTSFDALSLGADGAPGGEANNADILLSELLASSAPRPRSPEFAGLQRDLADALHLQFQLDGIDYSHAHWRNSDLSVEQIQAALAGKPIPPKRHGPENHGTEPGADVSRADRTDTEKAADALFGALSGDSMLAKAMGFMMKMLGASSQARAMIKIVLADTLVHADAILQAQPAPLAELMKVLTVDRNTQVIHDLRAIIADEPETRSVAVFYGAGHFFDLEKRICSELGYRHESTLWVPAITIDINETGMTAAQLKGFRALMRRTIEQQLKQLD